METQAEIDAHNRAELLKDARAHIASAQQSLEQAQGCYEDLRDTEMVGCVKTCTAAVNKLHEIAQPMK